MLVSLKKFEFFVCQSNRSDSKWTVDEDMDLNTHVEGLDNGEPQDDIVEEKDGIGAPQQCLKGAQKLCLKFHKRISLELKDDILQYLKDEISSNKGELVVLKVDLQKEQVVENAY